MRDILAKNCQIKEVLFRKQTTASSWMQTVVKMGTKENKMRLLFKPNSPFHIHNPKNQNPTTSKPRIHCHHQHPYM